jgi:pimeloyl-ACP methyl ester carboxylesterase
MHLFYTHGMGGSMQAQPEIEDVFGPLGYTITRIPVPYHDSVRKLVLKLATLTFGGLCLWIDEGANRLLDTARRVASQEYVVVGDSMGGFISLVAAQRDARVSHCVLLSCSGDICDAAMRLRQVSFAMRLIAGRFTFRGKGGISRQAYKAIGEQSDFQQEFDRVNTFQPERLARLRRLLILRDKGDPVAPEAACERFAQGTRDSVVRMVYNEGRHHPIGKDALQRYAVPFLQNHPMPAVS